MAKSLRNMMGAGIGAGTASLLNGTVADNLTATGSAQADALSLPGDVNVLTTVGFATGVRLPALPQPGDETLIANFGANALNVYPPPGATIEGGPSNAPFSLPAGAASEFVARVGSSNWIALGTAGSVAGTLVNTVLPKLIDGQGNTVTAPIVGQTYFMDPGTFVPTPTSFISQMYDANGAIAGETGSWNAGDPVPSFLVVDAEVGLPLHVGVIASNGLSSLEALSTATSAVADIDLTNAITAFTRTSASGVTPITLSITYASNVYEGYTRRWNVYSDSGKSTLLRTLAYTLTNADVQPGALIDLVAEGVTYTATDWIETGVETTSPNGIFHSFTYPTALSPTDAVVAMTWSTADAATIGATLSGGNLTVTRGGGYANLKASRGVGAGKKVYWELTPTFAAGVSVADSSAVLTDYWAPGWAGGTQTVHAAMYSGNDSNIYYDASGVGAASFAAGAVIGIALDTTVSPPVVYFAKNNVWQQSGVPSAGTGGQAMASISSPIYPAVMVGGGNSATANFGATAFVYTPPTGFVAP